MFPLRLSCVCVCVRVRNFCIVSCASNHSRRAISINMSVSLVDLHSHVVGIAFKADICTWTMKLNMLARD